MKLTACNAVFVACLALAGGAQAAAQGDKLIASNKCNRCHGAKTAPSDLTFAAIAKKYEGRADAAAKLVDLLKTGGPHDHDRVAASDTDLKAIVAAVLATK